MRGLIRSSSEPLESSSLQICLGCIPIDANTVTSLVGNVLYHLEALHRNRRDAAASSPVVQKRHIEELRAVDQ